MAYLKSKRLLGVVCVLALVAVALIFALPRTEAQVAGSSEPVMVQPAGEMMVEAAVERTWEHMKAEEALAPAASGPRAIPFRTPINEQDYQALKAQSFARAAKAGKPGPQVAQGAPHLKFINFLGDNMTNLYPPDTHGAVGHSQFCQIVNSRFTVYKKINPPGNLVKQTSLATFFGYATETLFDPRVIYDPVWKRWIVTADADTESGTVQWHYVAVSKTSKADGAWWIYRVNTKGFSGGVFWDFPQLGQDQDAIIITANNFSATDVYIDTRMFSWPKAMIYNGKGFTFAYYTGLEYTLAPPIVLDGNLSAFLLAAHTVDNKVYKYTLTGAGRWPGQTLAVTTIPVPAYTVPPDAWQPGTATVLDTLDSRFANAGTQIGSSSFQVHVINLVGYAAPKFYEFNTTTNAVVQSGFFYKSLTSYDFNASIAANASKDVFVGWTATDTAVNAQVRFSGRRNFDAAGVIDAGFSAGGSATYWTLWRWGDYSAVTIDPSFANGLTAWGTNERINTHTKWGSRITRFGY